MVTQSKYTKDSKSAVGSADRTSATLNYENAVTVLPNVSARRAAALGKRAIYTVRDLVVTYPRRYVDLSSLETVQSAQIGESCTISGTIHSLKLKRPRRNLPLVEITLVDSTGTLMVTAFRQPWLMDSLHAGMAVAVAGKVEFDYGFKRMTNPFIEPMENGATTVKGSIIPVHPACAEISTAWMRRLVSNALEYIQGIEDFLPADIRAKYKLMSRSNALRSIHFPLSMEEAHQAHRRLAYEEVFLLELALMRTHLKESTGRPAVAHEIQGPGVAALREAVPFELTGDQQKAIAEILRVMATAEQANHMLLGDVGTGKTVVAAFALVAAADTGNQAVMMAPTEVLAQQYSKSLGSLLDAVGIRWALLTGSTLSSERKDIIEGLAQGKIQVLFGTHAVLEKDVILPRCSLCVIDEQQRFGVEQRAALLAKGAAPDALYLTATPIPRSLALALFGNLSLSYLHERPHSEVTRTTKVVARSESSLAYDAAREALERGEQVYVVCPLVGMDTVQRDAKAKKSTEDEEDKYEFAGISIESESDFAHDNVTAAENQAKRLQDTIFYDFQVGLLHGKMRKEEKQQTMEDFRSGSIDVLVATTVIEVGVDVPNATVMIIEDADRFGLSQLHQLRGRVGRGTKPAQVFLISNSQSKTAVERLSAMETTDDGFELATYDLSLRREGDILGNRQHGASSLKLVNVVRDAAMIEAAWNDAHDMLAQDPDLSQESHRALRREVASLMESHTVQGG